MQIYAFFAFDPHIIQPFHVFLYIFYSHALHFYRLISEKCKIKAARSYPAAFKTLSASLILSHLLHKIFIK